MTLETINNERVYHDQFNTLAYQNKNVVISGAVVTEDSPQALTVEISEGELFFSGVKQNISAQTSPAFAAPDTINDRIDLLVVNSSGTVSIVSGEALKSPTDPRPPAYDPETYVVLARITFNKTDTIIATSNIKDMRSLNELIPFFTGTKASSMIYNTTAVATSATLILTSNVNRKNMLIYNNSPVDIYIGASGVTVSDGFLLEPQQAYKYEDTDAIYAVHGDSGTKDLRYMEVEE